MAKLKLKSKREYLRLDEVTKGYGCTHEEEHGCTHEEEHGCTHEELFSEAAIGELTIYVDLDQSQAAIVWSKHLMKQIPQTDGETIIEEDLKPPNEQNFRKANKDTKIFYRYTLFGMQPIESRVFEMNKSDRDSKYIDLDIGKSLTGKNGQPIFFDVQLIRYPSVTLQEALDKRRLLVMKSDLQKMLSEESSAPVVAKPKVAASKKAIKGSRPQTLERYADWQRRADLKIRKNPSLSAYAVAESIYIDLHGEESRFLRSVDAIRQHIKI